MAVSDALLEGCNPGRPPTELVPDDEDHLWVQLLGSMVLSPSRTGALEVVTPYRIAGPKVVPLCGVTGETLLAGKPPPPEVGQLNTDLATTAEKFRSALRKASPDSAADGASQ